MLILAYAILGGFPQSRVRLLRNSELMALVCTFPSKSCRIDVPAKTDFLIFCALESKPLEESKTLFQTKSPKIAFDLLLIGALATFFF